MLAGQRAAKLQRGVEEVVHSPFHARELFLVAAVAEDGRMQIAVTGMAEGGDGDVVAGGDLVEGLDHGRDLGARHCGVFQHQRGTAAGQRGNGHAAGFPNPALFHGIAGDHDFRGAVVAQHLFHDHGFVLDLRGVAVHLDEQHGPGITGEADFHVVFNVVDRGMVKKFQRTGHHMGRDDPGDGL